MVSVLFSVYFSKADLFSSLWECTLKKLKEKLGNGMRNNSDLFASW